MLLNTQMHHYRSYMLKDSTVSVQCSHPAIVMLMSDGEYERYLAGLGANFYGGYFIHFPTDLQSPGRGYWNIIIEPTERGQENIKHAISFIHREGFSSTMKDREVMMS
ncbi:Domain of uncharacterised function (DUF1883) [Serratia ficaria]|nr:Domain of uncharacterised function (DUF1883) [Serratia ficaria]